LPLLQALNLIAGQNKYEKIPDGQLSKPKYTYSWPETSGKKIECARHSCGLARSKILADQPTKIWRFRLFFDISRVSREPLKVFLLY
jgi:hypothetical protein